MQKTNKQTKKQMNDHLNRRSNGSRDQSKATIKMHTNAIESHISIILHLICGISALWGNYILCAIIKNSAFVKNNANEFIGIIKSM